MAKRNIIRIDEEKCDGCGACVIGCAEGALEIIDGKAKLVSDIYCDGLGACIGDCPQGALEVIEREAPDFDEEAVEAHLARLNQSGPVQSQPEPLACGCPGSMVQELKPLTPAAPAGGKLPSALSNWPIQLHLVPPEAPFLKNAELLIAADCTGFSLTGLHQDFLRDKALIIACPKLDDTSGYEEKLIEIFRKNNIKDVTVLYMTVPCCYGMVHLVSEAAKKAGGSILLHLVQIDPSGEVVQKTEERAA